MREITLGWKGEAFVIPATKAFEIGERVEDIATLAEIASWERAPKFFKIARCYGEMLRFAGARVTNEEIHAEIAAQLKSGARKDLVAANAVASLLAVLMDGAPESGGEANPKKANAS